MEGVDFGPDPFLSKLYDVVDDPNTDTIISWGADGKSFVIWDTGAFVREIIPRYFKNTSSFSRQLISSYWFRTVNLKPFGSEFANQGFQRGKRELLKTIKRERPPSTPSSSQQGQAPSAACLEPGLDGEVHRLQRDKGIPLAEVAKQRQEQQATPAAVATAEFWRPVASPELPRPMEGLGEVGPTPFLTKIYDIVDDPNTDNVVSWGNAGNSFVFSDYAAFGTLIQRYFGPDLHNFARQLNACGFRVIWKFNPARCEVVNDWFQFQRGQRELLKINRPHLPSSPSSYLEMEHFGDINQFGLHEFQLKQIAEIRPEDELRQLQGWGPSSSQQGQALSAYLKMRQSEHINEFQYKQLAELRLELRDEQPDEEMLLPQVARLPQEQQATGRPIQTSDQIGFGSIQEIAQYPPPDTEISYLNMDNLESRGSSPSLGSSRLGHDAQMMRRSMTMPSFDSHTHGISGSGGLHHPERTRGYAAAAAAAATTIAAYGAGTGGGVSAVRETEAQQQSSLADLEAGGGSGATARQPTEEQARAVKKVLLQTYPALVVGSFMAYPVLKDAPKYVKITIFGGLVVIITIVLFAGILSRSLARRWFAFWVVFCSAIALLTFNVASQLS